MYDRSERSFRHEVRWPLHDPYPSMHEINRNVPVGRGVQRPIQSPALCSEASSFRGHIRPT